MGDIFYIIIFFLVFWLLTYGLVKLFFYFFPSKQKKSWIFKACLSLSYILVVIILTFLISPLYRPSFQKKRNDELYNKRDTITLYNKEKKLPDAYCPSKEKDNSYYPKKEGLSKREREELERLRKLQLHEEEFKKLEELRKKDLEKLAQSKKIREDELEKSHQLDKLVKGKIAYKVSDTMNVGKNYNATVIITKAMNDSILFENFHQGNFQKEEIKVSTRVKVVLIDPTEKNFDITPLNTVEQLVDDSTNTVWKWNIIPKQGGDNVLVLRVTVKVLDQLGENYKDIRVFEKTIKVYTPILTRLKQFIGNYWQWLSTVIVIPLGIWGYKIFSNRRKKNAELKQEQERKQKEFEKWITQK